MSYLLEEHLTLHTAYCQTKDEELSHSEVFHFNLRKIKFYGDESFSDKKDLRKKFKEKKAFQKVQNSNYN